MIYNYLKQYNPYRHFTVSSLSTKCRHGRLASKMLHNCCYYFPRKPSKIHTNIKYRSYFQSIIP